GALGTAELSSPATRGVEVQRDDLLLRPLISAYDCTWRYDDHVSASEEHAPSAAHHRGRCRPLPQAGGGGDEPQRDHGALADREEPILSLLPEQGGPGPPGPARPHRLD